MNDFYDYRGNNISNFIANYRQSLQGQRDSAIKQLEQQRRNDYASIMGGANRRGMMYSTWTGREKQRYNTGTYLPNLVKVNSSYTTGLDTLRANAAKLWNQIQAYNEATQDLGV